ncbi:MAG: Rab family GTPase [Candidatus Thorarchaeota archaeon]
MFKIVLIGDGTVGKTSIRRNYLGEGFKTSHIATIGVDFAQKYLHYKGVTVRLVIWDLAGQPTFETVRRHYYQGCSGMLLVYSVVDRESFDNASKWMVEAFKNMGELPPTAIIANKIDLREENSNDEFITTQEGEDFTNYFKEKMAVPSIFLETSAKTGHNVLNAFDQLIDLMLEYRTNR